MVRCNRCGAEVPDLAGTFWREPILVCPSCGARHQRETRFWRLVSWAVISPFVIAFVVAWSALAIVVVLYIYSEAHLSLSALGAVIALVVVAVYVGWHLFGGIKDLFAKREATCIEK